MKTNHQKQSQNSSRKFLHVNRYALLALGSAAFLASAGGLFALWPGEPREPHVSKTRLAPRETQSGENSTKQSTSAPRHAELSHASKQWEEAPRDGNSANGQGRGSHHDRTSAKRLAQLHPGSERITEPSPARTPSPSQTRCEHANCSQTYRANTPLRRGGASSFQYLPNTSGVPKVYAMTNEPNVITKRVTLPKEGSALNSKQFSELMTGRIHFSPQELPPTGKTVTDSTPLELGQEVLLRWEKAWWAATVTGFEPDGAIRVTYFGWPSSWDEAVPRSDLQLDTNTREKAIQTVYSYKP